MSRVSERWMVFSGFLIVLANYLIPFVVLIWFGVIGEWEILAICAVLYVFGNIILGLVVGIPLMILSIFIYFIEDPKSIMGKIFGALIFLVISGSLTAWCIGVLYLALQYSSSDTQTPMLLSAYLIGIAAIQGIYSNDFKARYSQKLGLEINLLSAISLSMMIAVLLLIFSVQFLYASIVFLVLTIFFTLLNYKLLSDV